MLLSMLSAMLFNNMFNVISISSVLNVAVNAVSLLFHADFNAVPKAFYDFTCVFKIYFQCFDNVFIF